MKSENDILEKRIKLFSHLAVLLIFFYSSYVENVVATDEHFSQVAGAIAVHIFFRVGQLQVERRKKR